MSMPVTFEDLQQALHQRGWELAERQCGGYTATTAGGSVLLGDLEQVAAWFSTLANHRPRGLDSYIFNSNRDE